MITMMSVEEKTYSRILGDVGKSLYVTIPFPITILLRLEKGDVVEIKLVDGKIIVEKKKDEK